MIWALVILVALSIPLTAIILDSPVVRAWAERHHPPLPGPDGGRTNELERKVETLESELEAVNRELGQLKEGQQFIQRLLEDPARQGDRLPKPPAR